MNLESRKANNKSIYRILFCISASKAEEVTKYVDKII